MIEYVFVASVLALTGYAAYCDVKTTEVSDYVSLAIVAAALLFYLYQSIVPSLGLAELYLVVATASFTLSIGAFLRLHTLSIRTSPQTYVSRFLRNAPVNIDRSPLLKMAYRGAAIIWYDIGLFYADVYSAVNRVVGAFIGENRLPDLMGAAFLLISTAGFYEAFTLVGWTPIMQAVVSGTILFALGWSMYLAGLWGGADAFVLGAIGYAFPYLPIEPYLGSATFFPVPLSLLLAVFLVGSVYSVFYAGIVALRSKELMTAFWQDMRAYRQRMALMILAYAAVSVFSGYILHTQVGIPVPTVLHSAAVFLPLFAALLVLYRFLDAVDSGVMHRTIPVDELQAGDVLAKELKKLEDEVDGKRIVGLTEEQVRLVREHYDKVEVQTGVPFIVAYPLSIIMMLLFGDPLYVLILVMNGSFL